MWHIPTQNFTLTKIQRPSPLVRRKHSCLPPLSPQGILNAWERLLQVVIFIKNEETKKMQMVGFGLIKVFKCESSPSFHLHLTFLHPSITKVLPVSIIFIIESGSSIPQVKYSIPSIFPVRIIVSYQIKRITRGQSRPSFLFFNEFYNKDSLLIWLNTFVKHTSLKGRKSCHPV